jgi:YVTN family beta-propeller protein
MLQRGKIMGFNVRRLVLCLFVIGLLGSLSVLAQDDPPLPLYALPDARELSYISNTLALSRDALTVVAVNMLSNSATIFVPARGEILAEVPVGLDPRAVAITPNGTLAIVANHGDHTLSVIDMASRTIATTLTPGGYEPYGVVTNRDDLVYVAFQGSDEIAIVNLDSGDVVNRIPVGDSPAGLALWGDFLYVTHFWSGDLSLIYLPQLRVVQVLDTGSETGLSQSIVPDITRGVAYLPQTRSNNQNLNLTFDTTVFPVVNVIDLQTLSVLPRSRIALDTVDRPVNMPFAVAIDRFREWLFVANAGTNDVSLIDLNTGLVRAHFAVGQQPRGILLNADSTLLYVHNVFDGTITIIRLQNLEIIDVMPISNINMPINILIGAQMFYSADDPRISADGWVSCANCHFDGESDSRVWLGFPGGPRNTPVLYDLAETLPYTWTASWDELADSEWKIRGIHGGTGLIEDSPPFPPLGGPNTGLSPDLDTLVDYLLSIPSPTSQAAVDDSLIERGAEIFTEQGCGECHVGTVGTNLQTHDVGTTRSRLERNGTAFDTPTMRWLWLSGPYFHDGAADTLYEVFTLPGTHQLLYDVPPEDIDALVAYLMRWSSIPK